MPLPKGINTPAVRAAWLSERKEKLAEFDRLTGKGYSEAKALRTMGLAPGSIRAMRRSVELLEAGHHHGRGAGENIDLGLALLSCVRKPGVPLSYRDIAAWCDCAPSAAIQRVERLALAKVRQRLVQSVRDPALLEELKGYLAAKAAA